MIDEALFAFATARQREVLEKANDAWHRKSGYRSRSSMKVITYHKDYGELGRSQFHVDTMMEATDAL